jgi:2-methylisocitrate lyase-like PEP mutase family enzyme
MVRSRAFRKLIEGNKMILRPCAYDALSAVLIEKAGFAVVGTSGYAISASIIGQPDIGLVSFGEMLERVRTIVNSVSISVDADVDTGYGNALNAYWTVKNFAWIRASGVRLEDQTWPKRCGHMAGKQVISKEEMTQKIRAAIEARNEEDPDMIVGARTDARSVAGLEETVDRGVVYAKAGADYVYVEAPQSLKEVEMLVKRIPAPVAFNLIPGGRTPPFPIGELERLGVRYLSVPMACLYPAAKAMREALKVLRERRDLARLAEMGLTWAEFNEVVAADKWRRRELELSTEEELLQKYGTTKMDEIARKEKRDTEEHWRK